MGSGAFRRGRDRDRDLGGAFQYSRRLTRLYGQAPLGLEGSGAFRRPGSMVRALRTGPWVRPAERAGSEGSFICRCLGQRKPYNRPGGRGNAIPLWWLAPPPCTVGSMSLDSRVAGLPYESSPFATPTSRGRYKAPLCCELLMKGLPCGSLLSHRSAGGEGGAVRHQRGESHRRWLITVVLIITYDTESKSRNADFMFIAP